MLRAAQRFRLLRRIEHGLCAIGPDQPAKRRFEARRAGRRADRKQAAFAFHHHRPRLDQRSADQRDAGGGIGLGAGAHPFGAGPRLAETAPGHDQPYPPVSRRRQLGAAGPQFPVPGQFLVFLLAQPGKLVEAFLLAQPEQGFEQDVAVAVLNRVHAARVPPAGVR